MDLLLAEAAGACFVVVVVVVVVGAKGRSSVFDFCCILPTYPSGFCTPPLLVTTRILDISTSVVSSAAAASPRVLSS